MNYQERREDPRWLWKRIEIFLRDGKKCTICNDGKRQLHCHHKRYTAYWPWEEPNENLTTLCKDCHTAIHYFKKNYNATIVRLKKHDEPIAVNLSEDEENTKIIVKGFVMSVVDFEVFDFQTNMGECFESLILIDEKQQVHFVYDRIPVSVVIDDLTGEFKEYLEWQSNIEEHFQLDYKFRPYNDNGEKPVLKELNESAKEIVDYLDSLQLPLTPIIQSPFIIEKIKQYL